MSCKAAAAAAAAAPKIHEDTHTFQVQATLAALQVHAENALCGAVMPGVDTHLPVALLRS